MNFEPYQGALRPLALAYSPSNTELCCHLLAMERCALNYANDLEIKLMISSKRLLVLEWSLRIIIVCAWSLVFQVRKFRLIMGSESDTHSRPLGSQIRTL